MIIQILPVQADTYSDWYQVDTQDPQVIHTVRFVVDGEEISAVSVADGSSLTELPEGPEKSGYRFIGWFALDLAVTLDTVITADMTVEAAYEKEDDSLITGPVFVGMGLYANVTVSGTYHKDQQPSVERTDSLGGNEAVLEAWTVSGIGDDTALTVEALITSLPDGGTLSAWTVMNGALGEKIAAGLSLGDRVTFGLDGIEGIALVIEKAAGDGDDAIADGILYANEYLYLTGKLPKNGVIDAQPVSVTIDGEEVLAACDIRIYANENQRAKGKTWQPAGSKVQVHFFDKAFDGEVNIYHVPDTKAAPEYLGTVTAAEGWVVFDAASFSAYAVTRSIVKDITIDGSTYRIAVGYDSKAGIPDGAELDVKEVSGDEYLSAAAAALGLSGDDEFFYSKFLDIAIVYNGAPIVPKAPVTVTVELLDMKDGAEALEVVHFGEQGAEKVDGTVEDGAVTFTTDAFSVFGFGSVLHSLLSWTGDTVSYKIQGFGALATPRYTDIDVKLEEGLETIAAYSAVRTRAALPTDLYVKVSTAVDIRGRESIVVYSVKDGALADVLAEGSNIDGSLFLGDADGFAVVKDSGYRRKEIDLGSVVLGGMLPKEAEAEAVEAAPDLDGVLAAFDITIDENGVEYQPDDEHPVRVSIALGEVREDADLHVWHIADDGSRTEITEFTYADGIITFTADGFSIYAITDGDEGENARIGYRFWYNDGTQNVMLNTQYFRYKDLHPTATLTLREPTIPGIDSSTWNRIFKGWSKTSTHDEDANLLTLQNLKDELEAMTEPEFVEGTIIDVYANLENVYYVTYVDINPNNVLATEIVPVAQSGNTTFTIKSASELHPTITADNILLGWYDIAVPDTVYEPGQANVTISSNMTLYPKISGGYWLIFNDNDPVWSVEQQAYVSGGASFTPPAFYLNEDTVQPDDPTWTGYQFGGWYTDADCTTPFEFGGRLQHDTTVYAKWIPAASSYRVVYWKQRPTDDVDATDEEKTYDYAGSRLVETGVQTGQVVSLDPADTRVYGANGTSTDPDKQYFTYNAGKTDQTIVVNADGSSVLNVYYDRQVITINFSGNLYYYEETTEAARELYGLVNGEFVRVYPDGNGGYEIRKTDTWTETVTHHYTGTRYNTTTSNDSSPQQYYVNGGSVSQLYYHSNNGGHWSTRRTHRNNDVYTGTRYVINTNGSYGFVNGAMITLDANGDYTTTETVTGTVTTPYEGLVYKRVAQNGLTLRGLYGRSMKPGEWPTSINGDTEYWWRYAGTSGNVTLNAPWNSYTIPPSASAAQINSRTWNLTQGSTPSTGQTVYYYGEDLDGNYTILLAETSRGSSSTLNVTSEKFYGYHTDYWTYGLNGSKNNMNGGSTQISTSYFSSTTPLYIYYARDKFSLTFYTNNGSNQMDVIQNVPYEKPLTSYAGHSEGQYRGYFFRGWFADPSCSEPFDFSQTMPHTNVAVYGKWELRRVRVVIVPGASNVYMGSQATTFRINYDERIDGGLMESSQRAGYILDGWYTDPSFTNRFLFSDPINDDVDVDWTYQEDAWRATRIAYGDDDESHRNVRGILHLYAKWIMDTDSTGINVVYDPGDAAVYDSLGNLLTDVPVDARMYTFDGTATAREAPSNYSDLYSFVYWEATLRDGTTAEIHSGSPITLADLKPVDPVYDEANEILRYTVVLRAVYDLVGDPARQTTITYDGNTFSETMYNGTVKEMQGMSADGTHRKSITLDKEVNQTVELPSANDFYLNGWELVGWSFTEGTYAEQLAGAAADPEAPNFAPGQQVAADNLDKSDLNDRENTLYAMWQPKKYTVTVRQVIEDGVPDHSFAYVYKRGVENAIGSAAEQVYTLVDSSSFTETDFEYYERVGHVFRIQTPDIPDDAIYDVRVNAVVTHDDGTTEILNTTAAGDYQILGDITITYTYSLKVLVKLRKRDATNHSTVLTGATFTVTPVEFNPITNRWENVGSGRNLTVNTATLEQYLQEGTYKITETSAPADYALASTDLYLTIRRDGAFSLFTANGGDVSVKIAELDSTGKILTVYDNPIRTVTLSKTLTDAIAPDGRFTITVTVLDEDGARVRNYDVGAGTTNNLGQVTIVLGNNESANIRIPHGYKLSAEETAGTGFLTTYQWNSETAVESAVFPQHDITANGTLAYSNIRKYTLTYKNLPDGSAFTGMEQHSFNGAAYTLDPATIITMPDKTSVTPIGYRFAGWATAENGPVVYAAGDTETVGALLPANTGDKVLYAVWEPDDLPFKVHLFEPGDSDTLQTVLETAIHPTELITATPAREFAEGTGEYTFGTAYDAAYQMDVGTVTVDASAYTPYSYAYCRVGGQPVSHIRYSADTVNGGYHWEYSLEGEDSYQPVTDETFEIFYYKCPVSVPVYYVTESGVRISPLIGADGNVYMQGQTALTQGHTVYVGDHNYNVRDEDSDLTVPGRPGAQDQRFLYYDDGGVLRPYYLAGYAAGNSANTYMSAVKLNLSLRLTADGIVYAVSDSTIPDSTVPDTSLSDPAIYAVYEPAVELTIEKQVTGGWGDRNKAFDFTVSGLDGGAKYVTVVTVNGTPRVEEVTASADGTLTFSLKDDETFVIYLPAGETVTITEISDAESSRYRTTWDQDPTDTKVKDLTVAADQQVVVTNNLEPVAPTGHSAMTAPYCILLLAGALLLLVSRGKRRPGKGGGAYE